MEESDLIQLLEQFEIATLANEHTVIATTNFALYLSLLSGYLVAAYLAGHKLKKSQILLINSVYAVSAIYFAMAYVANIAISTNFLLSLARPDFFHAGTSMFLYFAYLIFFGMLIAIPFSIRFMREIGERND